jgi:cytochrome P450
MGAVGGIAGAVRSAQITAELVWFFASAAKRADPYPAYARLRQRDPVHHSPIGVWLVSAHEHVSQLLRDPRLSSNENHIDLSTLHLGPLRRVLGRADVVEDGAFFERAQGLMLFLDPPDHTRLRGLVNRSFTPRRVRDLEGRIEAIASDLLDAIVDRGRCDLMAEFAYPFPARVICELIGVPPEDTHHITGPAPALAGGLEPGPLLTVEARDAANDATLALTAYLRDLIERRRRDPGDDLLSALLHADEGQLDEEELISVVLLLLIAGHETTANLLGNGMVALLDDPSARLELRDDPSLDAAAVEELLRYDSPVQMTLRIATERTPVGDKVVEPGAAVVLCTGAANHDPSVHPRPERLDWHRAENQHLAFGGGIHYCLGAQLARTEARIGLRALLDRIPRPALASDPVRRPSFTIRGLERLDLTWT